MSSVAKTERVGNITFIKPAHQSTMDDYTSRKMSRNISNFERRRRSDNPVLGGKSRFQALSIDEIQELEDNMTEQQLKKLR